VHLLHQGREVRDAEEPIRKQRYEDIETDESKEDAKISVWKLVSYYSISCDVLLMQL